MLVLEKRHVLGGPPGWSRSHDFAAAFEAALAPAMRQEVDLVVHSGDLFDRSKPPRAAVLHAARVLTEVARRVPVVVVHGNHDWRGLRRYLPHVSAAFTVNETLADKYEETYGIRPGVIRNIPDVKTKPPLGRLDSHTIGVRQPSRPLYSGQNLMP